MRLFIDTNIFLEIILDQERAIEARALLSRVQEHQFFTSDFALHSVGLLLFRQKQYGVFRQFLNDMVFQTGMEVTSLSVEDMDSVLRAAQRFNLDFDDSYQYVAATKVGLTVVSFDRDFDRTESGRKTPDQVLAEAGHGRDGTAQP